MVFGLGKKRREKKASAEAEKDSTKKQIPAEEQTAPVSNEVKPVKKKKEKENELTGARDGRRRGKKKKVIRSGSRGYNSPLRTIAEDDESPRTRDTQKSDGSVLHSVNVMAVNAGEESTEVVMNTSLEETGEEVKLEDAPREESPTNEDVRKTLFADEGTPPAATVTPPAQESPFDEEAEFKTDEIAELNKSLVDDDDVEDESESTSPDDSSSPRPAMEPKSDVARKLLDAFNCGDDTTRGVDRAAAVPGLDLVINSVCGPAGDQKGPRYDPETTVDFLRETIKRGLPLLYHQPPDDDDVDPEEEWTGRSVHMTIKLGSYLGTHLLQPRLEWSTLGGGWSRTGSPDITTTSVELLNISSILGELDDERDVFGASADDLCFFTVTTNKGNVYLFEAATPADRDRIVYGLRSVIARLTFHLIAGDSTVSSELYGEEKLHASGELPSLRTPSQGLNEISHAFLDG